MLVVSSIIILFNLNNFYFANAFSTVTPIKSSQLTTDREKLLSGIDGSVNNILACPESLSDLKLVNRYYGLVQEKYLYDSKYNKKYDINDDTFIDLTIKSEADAPIWSLSFNELIGQRFFQNPLISTAYERGYRDNFKAAGFPGIDKEFEEVDALFTSIHAKTIMDLSCASGFMMRKFIKSGKYERVIGADLSPNMLLEARQRCREEKLQPSTLIRCDSARLPLKSNSLDGIHAGAAMHCWPRVGESIKEIYRVLRPGGAVYATTFLNGAYRRTTGFTTKSNDNDNDNNDNNKDNDKKIKASRRKRQQQTGFQFFDSLEVVEKLFTDAGFQNQVITIEDTIQSKTNEMMDNSTQVSAVDKSTESVQGEDISRGMLNVRLEGQGCIIIKAIKPLH